MEVIKNRYLLLDEIGEDRYFIIVNGYDKAGKKPVIIKILKDEYSISAKFVANLKKILAIIKALKYENLPIILEFGISIDKFFVVEQYEEGEYLDKKLTKELPLPTIFNIIAQIITCLKYIGQKNLVYGNLTLSSIFITTENNVRLTNLGLDVITNLRTSSDDIYSLGLVLEEIYSLIKKNLTYILRENFEYIIHNCKEKIYLSFDEVEKDVEMFLLKGHRMKEEKKAAEVIEAKKLYRKVALRKVYIPLMIITLLLLFVITSIFVLPQIFLSTSSIKAPDIVGLELEEAKTILKAHNLKLNIMSREYNEEVSPGHIIWQRPFAGKMIKEGRTIHVGVSKGKELITVPDLRGLTIDDAKKILQETALKLGEIYEEPTSDVEKGYVITQEPAPQEEVKSGTKVTLTVSAGIKEPLIEVPDFIGFTLSEAQRNLSELGLQLGEVKEEYYEGREINEIIEQTPLPGILVEKGSKINFVINAKKERKELVEADEQKKVDLNKATIEITVPEGEEPQEVKVIVSDDISVREVYKKIHNPNDRIRLTIQGKGKMIIQVYIDGELIKEEEI